MKNFLIAGVLMLCAVLGFTLPADLMAWKDTQRLCQVGQVEAEEVSMTYDTNMSFTEKLRFLQEDEVNTVELFEGKNFTKDEMIVHIKMELEGLQDRGLLVLDSKDLIYGVQRIVFQIDVKDGNRSMILWELAAISKEGEVHMVVDDETGKVLTLYHIQTFEVEEDSKTSVKAPVQERMEYALELEDAAQQWADYWDVELVTTASYDFPIPTWDEEMKKQMENLAENGMADENAKDTVYEEWGYALDEDILERRMYVTFEDEGGMAPMHFRKNTKEILFMIDSAIDYDGEN